MGISVTVTTQAVQLVTLTPGLFRACSFLVRVTGTCHVAQGTSTQEAATTDGKIYKTEAWRVDVDKPEEAYLAIRTASGTATLDIRCISETTNSADILPT